MPNFDYTNQFQKKVSKYPKTTSEALGDVLVTLDSIQVIPANETGFHKIYITYKDEKGETIATEFNPPSLARYTTTKQDGTLKPNINPNLDTNLSLFHEDLWLNPNHFKGMGTDNSSFYYSVDNNGKAAYISKFGVLYGIGKMIATATENCKDENGKQMLFSYSAKYKYPSELLINVTEKNIGQFGYMRTTGKINDKYGTYPADNTKVTLTSKAGNAYEATLLADKSPAYLETPNTKTLDFTSKFVKKDGVWVKVGEGEKGYPAGFYAYFTILSDYLTQYQDTATTKFRIYVTGKVNSFTNKDNEVIKTGETVVDYTNTNRRWFSFEKTKVSCFSDIAVVRDKVITETKPYLSPSVAEKHAEYLEFKGITNSTTNDVSDNSYSDTEDDFEF